MAKITDYELEKALELFGIEPTDTHIKQMYVFVLAMHKFVERNAKYKDLWKEYGIEDSLLHIKSKAARLVRLVGEDGLAADIDDAVDLLNYTTFFVRLFQAAQVFADQEAEGT